MSKFIFLFGMSMFDFVILNQYLNIFTKERNISRYSKIASSLLCSLVRSTINCLGTFALNLFTDIIIIYLYSEILIYKTRRWILLPVLYIGCIFVTEPARTLTIWVIGRYLPQITERAGYFISALFCELIRYFIVIAIHTFWNCRLRKDPFPIDILLYAASIMNIAICCFAAYLAQNSKNIKEELLPIGIIVLLVCSNIFISIIAKRMSELSWKMHQNQMIIREAKLKEEYYQEVEESNQKIRKIRHDLKNRLLGIYGLEGNANAMREEIGKILGEVEQSERNLYTQNRILNFVLNAKYREAQKQNISIESDILVPKDMNIEYCDIGVLFGNLLDNAIEACGELPDEQRRIKVAVHYADNMLSLKIINSKSDRTERNRKKEYNNHGIGLNSVHQIVEQYDGIFEYLDGGKTFEISAILYEKEIVQILTDK